eukprot:82659-Prymnesium_polylepis.1
MDGRAGTWSFGWTPYSSHCSHRAVRHPRLGAAAADRTAAATGGSDPLHGLSAAATVLDDGVQ